MALPIHILPGEHQDWIVKEDSGRELGHYPSKHAAEVVGQMLARKRKAELVFHDAAGRIDRRSRPKRGLLRRLFGA